MQCVARLSCETSGVANKFYFSLRYPGSFKQPPPGQAKSKPYNDDEEKMGEKVESLDESVSRRNFRTVVIRPDEVEMLDLSNPDVSRRERYMYDAKTEQWQMETTWP